MATFKLIDHDSGSPLSAHWTDSISDAGNMVSVTASAALGDTACGVEINYTVNNTFDARETLASLPGTNEFRLRYRYDPNTVVAPAFTKGLVHIAITASTVSLFVCELALQLTSASQWQVIGQVIDDNDVTQSSGDIDIPNSTRCVELSFTRSSASGVTDGSWAIYANGAQVYSTSGYALFTRYGDVALVRFQGTTSLPTPGSGNMFVDEVLIDDQASALLCAVSAFRLLGLAADSGKLYATGLEDTATLMHYDYSLSDLSEGASPSSFGAATNAGIDAASFGIFPVPRPGYDDYIYLRGRDGNDVKTQKFDYNDAATGWTDIGAGSATWDASKMAVGLHPSIFDPDDLMAVFTDNFAFRTRDEGTTWTSQGSTTGSLLTSTRHPIDDNKLLVGGSVEGSMDYSHNYGKTFSAIDIDNVSASRDHRVLASEDDGYVTQSSSAFTDDSTINLGDVTILGENEGWVRFAAVGISPSSVIDSAYIQFEASNTRSGSVIFAVFGEDADDPTAASDLADFNGRTRTSASVSWSPSDPWTAGCTYTTPDISTVVQEIVDRSGWATNNAMQFFIEYSSGCVGTVRQAESFDTASSLAPLLHIESTGSGGVINHIEVSL